MQLAARVHAFIQGNAAEKRLVKIQDPSPYGGRPGGQNHRPQRLVQAHPEDQQRRPEQPPQARSEDQQQPPQTCPEGVQQRPQRPLQRWQAPAGSATA